MTEGAGRLRRTLVSAPARAELDLGSSATLGAQFWLGWLPWRPTAAWTAVAALLAAGWGVQAVDLSWQSAALLLLLVDPVWGSLWRLAGGSGELLALHERASPDRPWLPYLQSGSPAAHLLGWEGMGSLPLIFRVALPTVVLALALAAVMGVPALWLTAAVIGVTALGRISLRTLDRPPALLHSLVTVALPWSLVLAMFGPAVGAPGFGKLLALLLLWTAHHWGETRAGLFANDRTGLALLALADLGMAALLVVAQAPLWLAILAILWLPTWLTVYRRGSLRRMNFWWLAAMLVTGLAMGRGA
jgi:hypothetical protein